MELKNLNKKIMFGVEHCYNDGASTYEIFATFNEAKVFCENTENWSAVNQPLFIFKADFNINLIFKENNSWNYDSFGDTVVGNFNKIKTYNTENNLSDFIF